jgi:hypothetical protein
MALDAETHLELVHQRDAVHRLHVAVAMAAVDAAVDVHLVIEEA